VAKLRVFCARVKRRNAPVVNDPRNAKFGAFFIREIAAAPGHILNFFWRLFAMSKVGTPLWSTLLKLLGAH
jgi:hypothetical protein